MATRQRVWISGGLATALLVLALGACSSKPPATVARSADDGRGSYKVGKPYTIDGITYYPTEDMTYSETGIASWYGPGFHGRYTASGEVYDQEGVSAAHKTLPMPSIVRVTNLDNGRTVIARINDRGPFVSGRIIDMSKGGARELGIDVTGTAHVRVEIMRRESEIVKQIALQGGGITQQMAALANPPDVLDASPGPVIASASEPSSPAAPSQPTRIASASQPIWSPGDPPPSVPMVTSDGDAASPPSSVAAAPVAPATPPSIAPAPVAPMSVAAAPVTPAPVASTPLAPPPSTLPAPPSRQVQVAAMPTPPVAAPVAPSPPVRQASWSPQELAQTNGVDADLSSGESRPAAPPSTLGNQAAALSGGGRHSYAPSVPAGQPPAANPRLAAPAVAGQGGLYVQAGAFSQLESAEKVRVGLARFGKVLVTPIQANGRELYRVRLGPMSDTQSADTLRQEMLRAGYRDARVVND